MAPLLGSWAGRPWQEGGLSLAALSSAGWAGRRGGLGVLPSPAAWARRRGGWLCEALSQVGGWLWSPEATGVLHHLSLSGSQTGWIPLAAEWGRR